MKNSKQMGTNKLILILVLAGVGYFIYRKFVVPKMPNNGNGNTNNNGNNTGSNDNDNNIDRVVEEELDVGNGTEPFEDPEDPNNFSEIP